MEEGDIIGDFPPGLHHLQHTHLVFLRFSHKAGFVCAETVQEVRSDMGKRVTAYIGYSSWCGVLMTAQAERVYSLCVFAPTKLAWTLTGRRSGKVISLRRQRLACTATASVRLA